MLFPYTKVQMQSEERLAPGKVCREYFMYKWSRSMYGVDMKLRLTDKCVGQLTRMVSNTLCCWKQCWSRRWSWLCLDASNKVNRKSLWQNESDTRKYNRMHDKHKIHLELVTYVCAHWVSHLCLCTLWSFDLEFRFFYFFIEWVDWASVNHQNPIYVKPIFASCLTRQSCQLERSDKSKIIK